SISRTRKIETGRSRTGIDWRSEEIAFAKVSPGTVDVRPCLFEESRMVSYLCRYASVPVVVLIVVVGLGLRGPDAAAQAPAAAGQAAAPPPVPRYDVRRAPSAVVVDGRMDEPAWQTASSPAALQALWDFQTGPVQATATRMLW